MIIKNKLCSDEKRFTPHIIDEKDDIQTIICLTCKNPAERKYKMIRQVGNTINTPLGIWNDYKKNGGDTIWEPYDAIEEKEIKYEEQQRGQRKQQWKQQRKKQYEQNKKQLKSILKKHWKLALTLGIISLLILLFGFKVI